MKNKKESMQTENPTLETSEMNGRREALKKLGKFSAYVAPFTVLALSQKAQAASFTGVRPQSGGSAARH